MHENYNDIKDKIKEEPQWYDQNGVPRYAPFNVDLCPDIYSNMIGLFWIECQECGQAFNAEMHANYWSKELHEPPAKWHYGDPPAHGCVGDTMNCVDIKVIEIWHRERFDWERLTEYEVMMD